MQQQTRSAAQATAWRFIEPFRRSLAGRFSLMFVALLIPLLVVGFTISRGITANARELLEARRVKELAAQSLALVLVQDDVTKEILLDVERISEANRKIDAYDQNRAILRELGTLSASGELAGVLREMDRIDEEELRPLDALVLETLVAEGATAAQRAYFSRYEPVRRMYQDLARELIRRADAIAVRAERELERRNRASVLRVVGALVGGMLLVALVMTLILRNIQGRLGSVVGVLEALARRDLSRELRVDASDEVGQMADALQRAVTEMRQALIQATGASNQVELAVKEISLAAECVATASSQQAGEVVKAAESMEQVTDHVWGIAESARSLRATVDGSAETVEEIARRCDDFRRSAEQLDERIDDTSRSILDMRQSVQRVDASAEVLSRTSGETSTHMLAMAAAMRQVDGIASESSTRWHRMVERGETGLGKVRETVEGIATIREMTRSAESVVKGLGDRAEEIGAILDVIDDVADETRLLALNAAIIAAQAGEKGRAFKVVSDEISNLAERVTVHTQEVEQRIRSVQRESKSAIEAMSRGSATVESVAALSAEAGAVVEEITRSSRESAQQLAEIAGAVRDQTEAAHHVSELMGRTDEAVGEIRASVALQSDGSARAAHSAEVMQEVARRLAGSTGDQIDGVARIRASIDQIRGAAEAVEAALLAQTKSTQTVTEILEKVSKRCAENTRSAELTSGATDELLALAETLRQEVLRFSL